MQYKRGPSFTGTEAAGDQIQRTFVFDLNIEKCPYLDDKSIISMQDFLKKSPKDSYTKISPKLNLIKEGLKNIFSNSVDPIEYLLYLYYREELSVPDIYKRLGVFGIEYSSYKSLWHLFSNTFKWETRGNEQTEMIRKKNLKANVERRKKIVAINENTINENIKKFNSSLNSIPSVINKKRVIFNQEHYSALNIFDRAFYTIECFGNPLLTKQYFFQSLLISENGARTGARIINQELAPIFIQEKLPPFEVSSGIVSYHKNNLNNNSTSP